MLRIAQILRDYREAGSVNGLLALWGFVDETTFLTKAGHVGVVYRVRGVDYEGLTHGQRAAMCTTVNPGFGWPRNASFRILVSLACRSGTQRE